MVDSRPLASVSVGARLRRDASQLIRSVVGLASSYLAQDAMRSGEVRRADLLDAVGRPFAMLVVARMGVAVLGGIGWVWPRWEQRRRPDPA